MTHKNYVKFKFKWTQPCSFVYTCGLRLLLPFNSRIEYCNRDCMTLKTYSIYHLALPEKCADPCFNSLEKALKG